MAKTYRSILNSSRGRFVSITVQNTRMPKTTASVKIVSTSPQYVTVREYDPKAHGEFYQVKFHRNSIKRVSVK